MNPLPVPPLTPEAELVAARLLHHQIRAEEEDPELFRLAVDHRHELTAYFAAQPGWRFEVNRAAGIVRLYKQRSDPPADRPPMLSRSRAAARTAAPPIVLVLALLVCEHLWRTPQSTFSELRRALVQACGSQTATGRLPVFQPVAQAGERPATAAAHRLAFNDALRLLQSWHMISTDQPLEVVEHDPEADLLVTARRERLALLLACPPPSLLGIDLDQPDAHADALCGTTATGMESSTNEPFGHQCRQEAVRAVLDDPGVPADPTTAAGQYLATPRGRDHALDAAAAVGLTCTVRQDWWTVHDPQRRTTDVAFPETRSHEQQAALLLLDSLASRPEPMAWVGPRWAADTIAGHLAQRPWWATSYRHRPAALTAAAAAHLLTAGVLTTAPGEGWQPTPALNQWQILVSHGTPTLATDTAEDLDG
ncbi:DUF2398 family protein [Streptomyces viridiviolaceus]